MWWVWRQPGSPNLGCVAAVFIGDETEGKLELLIDMEKKIEQSLREKGKKISNSWGMGNTEKGLNIY